MKSTHGTRSGCRCRMLDLNGPSLCLLRLGCRVFSGKSRTRRDWMFLFKLGPKEDRSYSGFMDLTVHNMSIMAVYMEPLGCCLSRASTQLKGFILQESVCESLCFCLLSRCPGILSRQRPPVALSLTGSAVGFRV